MALDLTNLPTDLDTLRQLVLELFSDLKQKESLIEKLKHELSCFRRHQFGRRSETVNEDQLLFSFLEELSRKQRDEAPPTNDASSASDEPQPQSGHGRKKLPRHLPRDRQEHPLPAEDSRCKGCGGELKKIRDEVSEQLEYRPASLYVKEHVRGVYACKSCEENVVTAPYSEQQPIEKGIPGPGLLAYVLTSKYADHLPLNRLEGIFARQAVEIHRSTMCGWVGASADLLRPIWVALKDDALESGKIHVDETTMPVLDRRRKSTRKASFWTYKGDESHPQTVYDYAPSKSNASPKKFLESYRGYLQADAHKGYDALYKDGSIVEAACMAHARRRFFDAKGTDPPRALTALAYFRLLYDIEREAKGQSNEARRAIREERTRSVLERFRRWLDAQSVVVLPKSPIGQAVSYTRSNWEALTRFVDSGILSIDNNAAERALRPVVIGRKNYLFAGSDAGGERAAIIYSLVETAKRHGVDPFVYFRDVLMRVSTEPARNIRRLFPQNWTSAAQTDDNGAENPRSKPVR